MLKFQLFFLLTFLLIFKITLNLMILIYLLVVPCFAMNFIYFISINVFIIAYFWFKFLFFHY